ncbi:unnamed protein product [Moneuplotes crassus]|uniref:Uncharacterized protein n=1 Tax=Euplotes crassus TaxID=5936 RepID=A0AAD1U6E3_EUPCR|nr:unnamed protein product [Moneuplotes crassus]
MNQFREISFSSLAKLSERESEINESESIPESLKQDLKPIIKELNGIETCCKHLKEFVQHKDQDEATYEQKQQVTEFIDEIISRCNNLNNRITRRTTFYECNRVLQKIIEDLEENQQCQKFGFKKLLAFYLENKYEEVPELKEKNRDKKHKIINLRETLKASYKMLGEINENNFKDKVRCIKNLMKKQQQRGPSMTGGRTDPVNDSKIRYASSSKFPNTVSKTSEKRRKIKEHVKFEEEKDANMSSYDMSIQKRENSSKLATNHSASIRKENPSHPKELPHPSNSSQNIKNNIEESTEEEYYSCTSSSNEK